MARVFTTRKGSTLPPLAGYSLAIAQPMAGGTNQAAWGSLFAEDDGWIIFEGTNTGLAISTTSVDWDSTGIWSVMTHSSAGNKANLFKYDTATETVSLPTPGASGGPNNWSTFKTGAKFHPTEAFVAVVGETATRVETASYVSGNTWTKQVGNVDVDFATNVFCCDWNKEGTHLVVAGGGATGAFIYTKSGTNLTKLASPFDIVPTGGDAIRGCGYNPTYPYLCFQQRAVGGTGTHPVYKYSGNSYTRVVTDLTSATGGTVGASGGTPCIKWSPDGLFVYIGSNSAGTAENLRAFQVNPATDVFTAIDVSEVSRLIADGSTIAISPDGKYLITGSSGSGTYLFKRHADGTLTFVKFINVQGLGNDTISASISIGGAAFSRNLYTAYGDKNFERFVLRQSRGNASIAFKFDEASGSVLDYSTGTGNLTTFIGTPVYQGAGKRVAASAMTFTGSQFVYKTTSIIGTGQQRSAVFMVIKPNVITGSQRNLFSQGSSTDANIYSELFITATGELGWRSSRTGGGNVAEKITSGLGLSGGIWYAILVRQDWPGAGSPRFWINGVEWTGSFTTSTTGTATQSDWFHQVGSSTNRCGFGARVTTTNTNFYSGDIDDLIVYNGSGVGNNAPCDDYTIRMLFKHSFKTTAKDSYAARIVGYNPTHYNRLNDPSITAAALYDSARPSITPTPATGGTWVGGANTVSPTLRDSSTPLSGAQQGFSMLFNGTTQFVDLLAVDGAKPSTSETGTLVGWFNGIPGTAGYIWSNFNDTQQQGMGIRVEATGAVSWVLRRSVGATNEVTLTTTNTFGAGWHQVVVVSDNVNNNQIYVDGVSQAYGTTTAGTATAKDWWADVTAAATFRPTIGACRTGAATIVSPYAGRVAECSLHNRELKSAEVLELYNFKTV
jgi:hypothetical protein